ncbi:MAG: RidA family protein [Gemmatimonadetes bacterium]|nr:RidA family protein [Gemmatimonadota bacterium]
MGRSAVQTPRAPAAIGPYSQAILSDGWIFTAGQLGIAPGTGELVEGGAAAQAEQALRNLAAILEAAGSGLREAVKTTVFLADLADYAAVNEVYSRHFTPPYPARSALQVAKLPKNALVEIEVIARRPAG